MAKRAREIFEAAQVTPPTPADLEDELKSWMFKSLGSEPRKDAFHACMWIARLPDAKKRKLAGCSSREEFLELVTLINPTELYENIMANIPPEIKAVVDDYKSHTIGLTKNKAGVTMFKNFPSLLLHYRDVETGKLAKEVKQSLVQSEGPTVVIAGPSGCGKTKLLYSYFSTCPGFYFCATTQTSGGSNDVTALLDIAGRFMGYRQYSRNRLIVRLLVLLLLASRMAIYKLCEGLSHKEWLVFQAACRGLCRGEQLSEAGTYDIFERLFLELAKVIPQDISEQDLSINIRVLKEFVSGCPSVAVDEAQILLTRFDKDYFESESFIGGQRPISNTFFEAISDSLKIKRSCSVLLVCGTSYTLHFRPDLGTPKRYRLFGIWERAEQMVEFAKNVLPSLSEEDIDYLKRSVFRRFRGRFRPFVSVVEQMLVGKSLVEAAEFVETGDIKPTKSLFEDDDDHRTEGGLAKIQKRCSGVRRKKSKTNFLLPLKKE